MALATFPLARLFWVGATLAFILALTTLAFTLSFTMAPFSTCLVVAGCAGCIITATLSTLPLPLSFSLTLPLAFSITLPLAFPITLSFAFPLPLSFSPSLSSSPRFALDSPSSRLGGRLRDTLRTRSPPARLLVIKNHLWLRLFNVAARGRRRRGGGGMGRSVAHVLGSRRGLCVDGYAFRDGGVGVGDHGLVVYKLRGAGCFVRRLRLAALRYWVSGWILLVGISGCCSSVGETCLASGWWVFVFGCRVWPGRSRARGRGLRPRCQGLGRRQRPTGWRG
ncbi:hypothetical protein B0T25DRAFT_552246 [Lasiosphaeria hispida]|uniref:Uncharacterized protein n=1 Tax=Lasiosphaeria hispida TaxID=260671 RepID=A0AAJ0HBM0_9PEZI|nr:hypothetical protein B0T25DRAFT_552246 [Lasiosphaeria hispida]